MTDAERVAAQVEALRITIAALFQTLPPQWKKSFRANVANVRRNMSAAFLRTILSDEQIEVMDEAILAMTWNPPDVSQ